MSSHCLLFIKTYFSKHKRITGLCISSAHKATTNTIFMKITVKYSFWMLIMIKNSFEQSNLIGRFVHDKIKTKAHVLFFRCKFINFQTYSSKWSPGSSNICLKLSLFTFKSNSHLQYLVNTFIIQSVIPNLNICT